MKRVLFVVLGFLLACGGGSKTPTGPTTPTQPATPANIAGNYTLRIAASAVCTQLPASFRDRSYPVTITQSGADFAGNFPSTNCGAGGGCSVSGQVTGNSVFVQMIIFEQVSTFEVFAVFAGGATGTVAGNTISGS